MIIKQFVIASKLALPMLLVTLLITAGCAESQNDLPPYGTPVAASQSTDLSQGDEQAPLLWRVATSSGHEVYLFGSIHIGSAGWYPLPDFIMDAFYSSGYLATEVDVDSGRPVSASSPWRFEPGRLLTDYISTELYERAVAFLTEHEPGFNPLGLTVYKPLYWMSMIAQVSFDEAGLTGVYGIETVFMQEAERLGIDILSLERSAEQLDIYYGLSIPLQVAMLEDSLDKDRTLQELFTLSELWLVGDEQGLEERQASVFYAEYIEAVLRQRDLGIADTIERYLAEGMNVFVIAGIDHMIGEGSIVDILLKRGHAVELVSGSSDR